MEETPPPLGSRAGGRDPPASSSCARGASRAVASRAGRPDSVSLRALRKPSRGAPAGRGLRVQVTRTFPLFSRC